MTRIPFAAPAAHRRTLAAALAALAGGRSSPLGLQRAAHPRGPARGPDRLLAVSREQAPLRSRPSTPSPTWWSPGCRLPRSRGDDPGGGAIFGLGLGTLLVSFASSAGATLAFLLARTLAARADASASAPGSPRSKRAAPRRCALPAQPAPGARVSLLPGERGDGADADPRRLLLSHQPDRHAARHASCT